MARGTLVDSNVLLDVLTDDTSWAAWSAGAIATAVEAGPVFINPVVYAEVSIRFSLIEDLEDALPHDDFRREAIPWEAAFLAGKSFLAYRRRRGVATSPLPDFFIGAHAAVGGLELLTRDPRRYRTYFPTVTLRTPE